MKKRQKRPKKPAKLEMAAQFVRRYGIASAAGLAVLLLCGGAVLWIGGYVGATAERAGSAIEGASARAGLSIRRVTVSGRKRVDPEVLLGIAGSAIGDSLLHYDPRELRRRVEALGWVRSARVTKLYPDTVHIALEERAPAAVWQVDGRLHLVDAAGAVIGEVGAYEYSALPLVVGAGAPNATADILGALARYPDLAAKTSALVRVGDRRWNLRLRSGLDVKLPETEFSEALGALAALDARHALLDQALDYVDLRDPDRMTLHKKDEAAQERPVKRGLPTDD